MPFAATWMQLEIIILSEVVRKRRQVPYDITYMWNLKYDTNEPIYETETESWTQRTEWCLPRRRGLGEGWSGSLGLADVSFIYRMDKQQGPTVQHRELYSISYDKP